MWVKVGSDGFILGLRRKQKPLLMSPRKTVFLRHARAYQDASTAGFLFFSFSSSLVRPVSPIKKSRPAAFSGHHD